MRGNTALAPPTRSSRSRTTDRLDNVVPIGQRLPLLELNEGTCHWPIGDPGEPEFFFCGGKARIGLPYCAHHSRIAYQPATERRRARTDAAVPLRLDRRCRAFRPDRLGRRDLRATAFRIFRLGSSDH